MKENLDSIISKLKKQQTHAGLVSIVTPLMKKLIESVKNTREELKKQNDRALDKALREVRDSTKALNKALNRVENTKGIADEAAKREVQSLKKEVMSSLENVRGEIPTLPKPFDPTPLNRQIAEVNKNLTTKASQKDMEVSITKLLRTVEELKKEHEEMKRRPAQAGGGVTNMRIQQAFKYILKTEKPTGDIDGVNTTYTVSQPVFAVLGIVINGETVAEIPNYTTNGNTITFSTAIPSSYSGRDFEIKYI